MLATRRPHTCCLRKHNIAFTVHVLSWNSVSELHHTHGNYISSLPKMPQVRWRGRAGRKGEAASVTYLENTASGALRSMNKVTVSEHVYFNLRYFPTMEEIEEVKIQRNTRVPKVSELERDRRTEDKILARIKLDLSRNDNKREERLSFQK